VNIGNATAPESYIEFGASRHIASAILAYMRFNPSMRAAINIRFDDRLVKLCRSLFSVSSYDRSKEPKGIKKKEGSSVYWGILHAIRKNPREDSVYHKGVIGKEQMIIDICKKLTEVTAKIDSLLKD